MKPARVIFSLLIVIGFFLVFVLKQWKEPAQHEVFDRHPAHLVYSKHALCRMDCRHINRDEIAEIMDKGIINLNKSFRNNGPCPTYALQGRTTSGDELRVVFAQCADETKVVTCYNLEKDFECHCPGDENKYH